jgi:ABC-type ATPase with predicted acetyltransferase domain
MYRLKVQKTLRQNIHMTERVRKLIGMFGLRSKRLDEPIKHHCALTVRPGDIVYITGASGAGKSVLLKALYEQSPELERLRLSDIPIETDRSLIDCIEGSIPDSLAILSKAGLSDVFCMLQSPGQLSEGQQWRYRLARAIMSDASIIFIDEFTSTLDRITAAVISFQLRKIAKQSGKIFILASCHEDVLPDLQPDVLFIKYLSGQMKTVLKNKACA